MQDEVVLELIEELELPEGRRETAKVLAGMRWFQVLDIETQRSVLTMPEIFDSALDMAVQRMQDSSPGLSVSQLVFGTTCETTVITIFHYYFPRWRRRVGFVRTEVHQRCVLMELLLGFDPDGVVVTTARPFTERVTRSIDEIIASDPWA